MCFLLLRSGPASVTIELRHELVNQARRLLGGLHLSRIDACLYDRIVVASLVERIAEEHGLLRAHGPVLEEPAYAARLIDAFAHDVDRRLPADEDIVARQESRER